MHIPLNSYTIKLLPYTRFGLVQLNINAILNVPKVVVFAVVFFTKLDHNLGCRVDIHSTPRLGLLCRLLNIKTVLLCRRERSFASSNILSLRRTLNIRQNYSILT